MTREEAIYELEHMKTWSKDLSDDEIEAIAIALKALNQEPILDKIRDEIVHLHDWAFSREEILQIIDKYKAESEGKEEKNEKL